MNWNNLRKLAQSQSEFARRQALLDIVKYLEPMHPTLMMAPNPIGGTAHHEVHEFDSFTCPVTDHETGRIPCEPVKAVRERREMVSPKGWKHLEVFENISSQQICANYGCIPLHEEKAIIEAWEATHMGNVTGTFREGWEAARRYKPEAL